MTLGEFCISISTEVYKKCTLRNITNLSLTEEIEGSCLTMKKRIRGKSEPAILQIMIGRDLDVYLSIPGDDIYFRKYCKNQSKLRNDENYKKVTLDYLFLLLEQFHKEDGVLTIKENLTNYALVAELGF